MRSSVVVAAAVWMCAVEPAHGLECADWSPSPSAPHVEPAITGNACRLVGDIVYAAGTEFIVVDVSVWDHPAISGRVTLPAAAQDMAVEWPRAWVACGDAGVVELDIGDPAAPGITRTYDPELAVTRLVAADGAVVGLDTASNLHFLATEIAGPLAARAVRTWGATVLAMTATNGFLVVEQPGWISAVNLRNPNSLSVSSRVATTLYSYRSTLAADFGQVFHAQTFVYGSESPVFHMELTAYRVSTTGLITKTTAKRDVLTSYGNILAAGGGRLLTTWPDDQPRGYAVIRDAATLVRRAVAPAWGCAAAIDSEMLVTIGPDGLMTVSLPRVATQLKSVAADGDLDDHFSPSPFFRWWAPRSGALWGDGMGVLTNTSVTYSPGFWSGSTVEVQYRVVCGNDPDTWTEVTADLFQDSQGNNYDACGLGGVRLNSMPGHRFLLSMGDACALRVLVCDALDSRALGWISDSVAQYEDLRGERIGRFYRTEGRAGIRWFDIASATPTTPIAPVPIARAGQYFAPDDQTLVVYVPEVGEFDTYDMTDADNVHQYGTWAGPRANYSIQYQHWVGRLFVYVADANLHVVDFRNPAQPALLSTNTLPHEPHVMVGNGSRMVLEYGWSDGFPNVLHREMQVVDVADDGVVTLHARCETGAFMSYAVSGNVVYADDRDYLRAYDVSNPDDPILIGRAMRGSGSLAIVGDYVASGDVMTPRDCRERRRPRAIDIDVRPVVKPGAEPGFTGPALVPVFVHSGVGFDAATLDLASVRFGPAGAPVSAGPGAKSVRLDGGSGSGAGGELLWFRLDQTGIAASTNEVHLTGRTAAGEEVLGIDYLNVSPSEPNEEEPMLDASPNPFNPQTTLSISLRASGPVNLVVYDIKGRQVRTLLDSILDGGHHTIVWDGRDDEGAAVASGVYVARFVAGGRVAKQRLALVR